MSWDIVLFNSKEKIVSVENLDDTKLEPVDFCSILEEHFHPVCDENWRVIKGLDFDIDYSVFEEKASNMMLHLYGENAIYALIELAKKHNWQIFDTGLGAIIDLEDPSRNGYMNFQNYLEYILKGHKRNNGLRPGMKKESMEQDLLNATKNLLEMARGMTFNHISDNCLYIISEIKDNQQQLSILDMYKQMVSENNKKIPRPLSGIMPELENLYPDFYDVNLFIYEARKSLTVVEVSYYPRSSLDLEYREKVARQETMLHSKVNIPPYRTDANEKFDINWQHGTLHHKWKMFWMMQRLKRETQLRKKKERK